MHKHKHRQAHVPVVYFHHTNISIIIIVMYYLLHVMVHNIIHNFHFLAQLYYAQLIFPFDFCCWYIHTCYTVYENFVFIPFKIVYWCLWHLIELNNAMLGSLWKCDGENKKMESFSNRVNGNERINKSVKWIKCMTGSVYGIWRKFAWRW